MSPATGPEVVLVGVTALHAGFQLTVSLVVYPALARLDAKHWSESHGAHGRTITPVVALVYGALAAGGGWALLSDPRDPAVLVTCATLLVAVLVTALVAAPTHGRLAGGPTPALLRRLRLSDAARTAAALVALAAAGVAALR